MQEDKMGTKQNTRVMIIFRLISCIL